MNSKMVDTSEGASPVVVVGSANMDMVVSCERFPGPGETVLGTDFGMYPGGKGANQAAACGRLGGEVRFVSRMGRDVFRDRLTASLREKGIDLSHVVVDEDEPTGVALISVDTTGENEIIVASGSNMRLSPEDVRAHRQAFEAARVVVLQLEIPLETVMEAAREGKQAGAQVILNPAPARELPDDLLSYVDVLTPNESEAALLSGMPIADAESAERAARKLIERGVRCVILTMGARGALLITDSTTRHFPALHVHAVDATGAGDAFNGALAFGIARGEDIEAAIERAVSVAAFSVTRKGAQPSMPSSAEVEAFVAELKAVDQSA